MTTTSASRPIEGLKFLRRGKVRDLYEYEDKLLLVATDRVSAFNVVLPCELVGKGKLLTAISAFWFERIAELAPSHLVTCDVDSLDGLADAQKDALRGRTMVVERLEVLPFEFVVRGYITGSGWKAYQSDQAICGIPLPAGLREADALPEPILTPTTKDEDDRPVTLAVLEDALGAEATARLAELSLSIYREGAAYAREKGVIMADTKFEFAWKDGGPVLIDEVLTPDSSRYWPLDEYVVGTSPPSYDKQIVRNWLEQSGWNKEPPGPVLPDEIRARTLARYAELYAVLTGLDPAEVLA